MIFKNKRPRFRFGSTGSHLAPQVGFEPTTLRLTAGCSTAELLRNIKSGSHLFSQAVASQVSSAACVLTVVFGMGTGVSHRRIATGNLPVSFHTFKTE